MAVGTVFFLNGVLHPPPRPLLYVPVTTSDARPVTDNASYPAPSLPLRILSHRVVGPLSPRSDIAMLPHIVPSMAPRSNPSSVPRRLQLAGRKRVESNGSLALPPPSVAVAAALAVAAAGGSGAVPAVAADVVPAATPHGVAAAGSGRAGATSGRVSSGTVRDAWRSPPSWDGPPDCGFLSSSPSSADRSTHMLESTYRDWGGPSDAAALAAPAVAAWPVNTVGVGTAGWSPTSGNGADDERVSPTFGGCRDGGRGGGSRGGGGRGWPSICPYVSPGDAVLPRPTTRAKAMAADSSSDEVAAVRGGRRVRPARRRPSAAAAAAAATTTAADAATAAASAADLPVGGGELVLCAGNGASLGAPSWARSPRSTSATIGVGGVAAGALIEDSGAPAHGGCGGRDETLGRGSMTASVSPPVARNAALPAAADADLDEPTAADVERLTAAAARLAIALIGAARVLGRRGRRGGAEDVLLSAMVGSGIGEAAGGRPTAVAFPATGAPPSNGIHPASCRSGNGRHVAAAAVSAASSRSAADAPRPRWAPTALSRSSRGAAAAVAPSATSRTSRGGGHWSSSTRVVAAPAAPPVASAPPAWSFAAPPPGAQQPPPGPPSGGWLVGMLPSSIPTPVAAGGGGGTPPVPSSRSRGRLPGC